MYIKRIELENYRNYKKQTISLINGINLFVGENAHGKTNIIESVYVCALGKSYRTVKDVELIKIGEKYARVIIQYDKNGVDNNIEYFIDSENKKCIKCNDIKVRRISEHVGEVLIVTFSPDSLDVIKGSPTKRRNFLDSICSQISKKYLLNLTEYNKCLKEKNSMLKCNVIDKEYLYVLHEKMANYIFNIKNFRRKVLKGLQDKSIQIHKQLTNNKEVLILEYISDFTDLSVDEIRKKLDSYLELEIIRKISLKGIQRDDIGIYINDLEVCKFGSQGQRRTALLSLKLANFELIKEIKECTPILLLDDIMSELDNSRINFLLDYIKDYQSIITTTDDNFLKERENVKISKVFNGRLEF